MQPNESGAAPQDRAGKGRDVVRAVAALVFLTVGATSLIISLYAISPVAGVIGTSVAAIALGLFLGLESV